MIDKVNNVTTDYNSIKASKEVNFFEKNPYDTHYLDLNKKVTFGESIKLFAKGFGKQIKDMVKGIVQHPIRTLATVGLTTGALLALPLVGIPTAVGGAAMAIGFATVGAIKMIGNTAKGIKHNRNGNGQLARDCFEKAGSAGVDVALSAPFIPKGLKSIKDFTKFGKIGVNSTLLSEFKAAKGIKNKIATLKNANTELGRNYDYQKLVESKLEELKIPKDKIDIYKKELLEFNVPVDDIPKVVMRKFVKSKGYNVEVPIIREAKTKTNFGAFSDKTGTVSLKDYNQPDLPATKGSRSKFIKSTKLINNDTYMATIEDMETGNLSQETMSRKIYDDYCDLYAKSKTISRPGNEILTTVHELEHWWQRGQINKLDGMVPKNATPQARALYEEMLRQQPKLQPSEYAEAVRLRDAANNYSQTVNPVRYVENELEVGARTAEAKVLNSPEFRVLDNVLKDIKDPSPFKMARTVLPPSIQVYNQTV